MAQQDATNSELTDKQESALVLLLAGRSDQETAAELGVDRSTVWRWRTGDAVFIAELNCRRKDLWASYADRLRALVPRALTVLENTLECEPDSSREALAILKVAGLVDLGAPDGPMDAAAVDRERRSREANAKNSERLVELSELMAL